MILKKNFFYICHNHNFLTFQQTRFWRKHRVSYPEVTKLETSERDIVTADFHHQLLRRLRHIPPPAVAQRTASFLFITNDIRHNQVNQIDIIQRSIISLCFQPDSLEGHQTPTCPVRKTSTPLPEFGKTYLNSMSDTLTLDKIMKSYTQHAVHCMIMKTLE